MAVYGAVLLACVFLFIAAAEQLPSGGRPGLRASPSCSCRPARPSSAREHVLSRMNDDPAHEPRSSISSIQVSGFSFVGQGENVGMAFVRLKPWGDREESADDFIGWANKAFSGNQGSADLRGQPADHPRARAVQRIRLPPAGSRRPGRRSSSPPRARCCSPRRARIRRWRACASTACRMLRSCELEVDRVQAQAMGLSVSDVYSALQLMLAPVYANDFTYEGRVLRVQLQADAPFRMRPEDLNRYRVRNQAGEMIPLDAVVRARWTLGPPSLERYNGFGAAPITGSPAAGHSSGDAMAAMERLTREDLPRGFGFEWSGQSLQEILSGQQAPMLFAISLIVVFLCLAALYESWSIPVAVLLVVPVGVLGALILTTLRGLPNDIYFKVGLLAIIGLAAKNAILIIAFARDAQLEGKPLIAATIEACKLRFRPIVMTSLAFVLGVLPLAISGGAGANSRHAIGTGVVGGMLAATTLGLLLVPVFYVVVRRLLGDRSTD